MLTSIEAQCKITTKAILISTGYSSTAVYTYIELL